MQHQNHISRHQKTLSKIRGLMAHRKRPAQEDEPENLEYNPERSRRFHRRCKENKPNYRVDSVVYEEEIDTFSSRDIILGLAAPSSTLRERRPLIREPPDNNITRRGNNLTISSWLIDMEIVKEDTKVSCCKTDGNYMIAHGMIKRDGIYCYCCEEVFSEFEFPRHALNYRGDEPYNNIFIKGMGVTLLTCMTEAWTRHSVPARNGYNHVQKKARVRDHHDDSCMICADGGSMMCCEKCPSTYHPRCMGFEGVPRDEWHCFYCHCRYCDRDSSKEILLTCYQCSKKYHWRCSRLPSSLQPSSTPFCGVGCQAVYEKLEGMVGRSMKISVAGELSWVLVRTMDLDPRNNADLHTRVTCNTMVRLAAKLMEDSFKRIVDRQSKTNMVQSAVYSCGSNFTRTNFSRFYTAVLMRRGVVVTVASLRTPSPDIAEIPLIATAEGFRNQGMRQMLFLALESALAKIGVEKILIPTSEEMVQNWHKTCQFKPIDEPMKRRIRTLNTLMFPRTVRLQKDIKSNGKMKVTDLNLPPPKAAFLFPDYQI